MSTELSTHLPLPDCFEACYVEYNRILPLETTDTHVRVAGSGEPDPSVIKDLEREFARPVELIPVSDEELLDGIRRAFAAAASIVEVVNDLRTNDGFSGGDDQALADARDLASQPPVVKYVNLLLRKPTVRVRRTSISKRRRKVCTRAFAWMVYSPNDTILW